MKPPHVNASTHGADWPPCIRKTHRWWITEEIAFENNGSRSEFSSERRGDVFIMSTAIWCSHSLKFKLENMPVKKNQVFVRAFVCSHNADIVEVPSLELSE